MSGKISFLIGAGFSAPFGIPTMGPFYSDFVAEAKIRYPSLESALDRAIDKIESEADLESLLSVLNAAVGVTSGLPDALINDEIRGWVSDAKAIRSHLLSYIIERCENFDRAKAAAVCSPLLQGLADSGTLIFSTNYDRVIEHACRFASVELSDGFESGSDQTPSPWHANFNGNLVLAKLHGSVTWYIDQSKKGAYWRLDRGYALPGPEFHLSRDGSNLSPLMIIPTLEKDVLGDPYSHLAHLFSDGLSDTALLVVMGSSLRDDHLTSTIKYHGADLVVLVIGKGADEAANRLEGNRTIALETSAAAFLNNCTTQLLQLVETVDQGLPIEELFPLIEEFAGEQRRVLSAIGDLDEEDRRYLADIRSKEASAVLPALSRLRGGSNRLLIDATVALLDSPEEDVRCMAAGNLGIVASVEAIEPLRRVAFDDPVSLVRIEAGLALHEIGTPEAQTALAEYQERHPDDRLVDLM